VKRNGKKVMGSITNYGFLVKKGDFKIFNFLMLTLAGIINSVGVTLLLAPVKLYDSGVSGLAMFLDMLIDALPLWSWLIIINFPIFLFGMKKQGIPFTVYSLYAIAVYSAMAAVFQNIIPKFVTDFFANGSPIVGDELILCSIFGGMFSGIGSGLTIRYGGTMDGIETLAVIFSKKIGISVGNFVMIFNVVLYVTIGVTVMASGQGDFSIPLFSILFPKVLIRRRAQSLLPLIMTMLHLHFPKSLGEDLPLLMQKATTHRVKSKLFTAL
jgi:uncharacterized membrane-anchored protein YitT (DUF2179 family)